MTATAKGPHWISSVFDLADVPTADLIEAKIELRAKCESIECQLGARREEPTLPMERDWRLRAKSALAFGQKDIERINVEINRRNAAKMNGKRRAIDVLVDLVAVLENREDSWGPEEQLVAEARELIALREQ